MDTGINPLDDPTVGNNLGDLFGETLKAQELLEMKTKELLNDLKNRRIFFYPACGKDWNPLHRFTHLCDTFVFCDYGADEAAFSDIDRIDNLICDSPAREQGLQVIEVSSLHLNTVNELGTPDAQPADYPNIIGKWGKVINLVRHIGGHQREIRLFYFRTEGVTLYRNLFNKNSIAPKIICLKQCEEGFGGQNWTTFTRWNGPLGRAVWENPCRPDFIVCYNQHDYNWPWNRVWQMHSDWITELGRDTLTSYVLPNVLPASGGAPMRCGHLFNDVGHLDPLNNRTMIKIIAPQNPPAAVADNGPTISLIRTQTYLREEIGSHSLQSALNGLRTQCMQNGTDHVHSFGCHFEDEAQMLYEWKWALINPNILPKSLTIHCESEGDLACYGSVADEIVG